MDRPFDWVLTALTYIRSPMIDDWVNAQETHLTDRTNPMGTNPVLEMDEVLWAEFKMAFRDAWTDMSKKQTVYVTFSSLDFGPYFPSVLSSPILIPFVLSYTDYIGLPRSSFLSLIPPISDRPLYYLVALCLSLYQYPPSYHVQYISPQSSVTVDLDYVPSPK